jgi:hypothetical protein
MDFMRSQAFFGVLADTSHTAKFTRGRGLGGRLTGWALAVLCFIDVALVAQAGSLESGFQHPPPSARPQTWWHWMNGNITKEGITADLEAMHRVGLGGAQIFNVDSDIPAGPVPVLSPAWLEMVRHAAAEADRLGLELCLHNCAGWSSSGGPWNTPAHAMQRVTTSELNLAGPQHFSGPLPAPPQKLGYYCDIAVLAFRSTATNQPKKPDQKRGPGAEKGSPSKADGPPSLIQNIEAKGGFNGAEVMSSSSDAALHPEQIISRSEIVDLTARLASDGRLDWLVPTGSWTILRIGYTPTGENNHPAPPEARGPECDKFSPAALDAHWNGYVQKVLDTLGPLAGRGKALDNVLIDSYEVGGQNWSPEFRAGFQKHRGYDPLLLLPTLTGRVVDSPEISERLLWDIRRTIADLFAENYYGHFQQLCHQHGLKASFEPYTGPFDSLQCGAYADIPMGEFWVGGVPDTSIKLASSVGHIFGQPIIGAESFTSSVGPKHGRWLDDPYSLKALGDLVFCQGINRLILHRYALQPWTNRWPGMTMGPWGTHFDRTITWFEPGRAWFEYLARCQFLLQQGRFVADAAYFCGESAPVELRAGNPALPFGYDYDALNADVLLCATMQNGRLVLPSGASYRVLILPPSDTAMRPALLAKLLAFVTDGLAVVGTPPKASPSLQDYPQCDQEVRELATRLWADCDGQTVTEHRLGKGVVVWGKSLAEVLAELDLHPDFSKGLDADLAYIHRRAGDTDIYFVSNQRGSYSTTECRFRVAGAAPQLWNPETGQIQAAPVWRVDGGRTILPMSFDPADSVFVVFRPPGKPSAKPANHLVEVTHETAAPAESPKAQDLRLVKAVYGAFAGSGARSVDVTREVQALVAAGKPGIHADNDLSGEDPAALIVKRLRVTFNSHGRAQTLAVKEGETLALPADAKVVKAIYGDFPDLEPGPEHTIDVTARLAKLIRAGRLNVRAGSSLAGRDPASGFTKELRVDYLLDGIPKHCVVAENETLSLPETDQPAGTPPSFEFEPDSGGHRLLAWLPGTFRCSWAAGRESKIECASVPDPVELSGPWEVHFPPGWGAPAQVNFEHLHSWPEDSDPGVKYFSGTATYLQSFDVPAVLLRSDREVWLDLGRVKNLAEVTLNGQPLGILWKPPFRVNITNAAKPGTNRLEIKVTNLWPNRLIGDEQLPPDTEWAGNHLKAWPKWLLEGKPSPSGRLTFTTWHHWKKDEALLDSGLLGPVLLRAAEIIPIRAPE